MKYLTLVLATFFPFSVSASTLTDIQSGVASDPQTILILTSYSLASAVLLGLITSALVFWNARKMKGGAFGSALLYLSIGMFLALAAFVAGSLPFVTGVVSSNIKLVHDLLFMIGYVFMAIGGHHIFTALQGKK